MISSLSPTISRFVLKLRSAAPQLTGELEELVKEWTKDLLARLKAGEIPTESKILNDPIWGSIILQAAETLLLDSQLLQRLRGVRQLGMAYLVYPGAGYDRLEHACGVVEAAARMMAALNVSAVSRPANQPVATPKQKDIDAIRLAALLHDIGHGPYSHTTENLIADHYASEIEAIRTELYDHFDDVTKVDAGEIITILMVLSDAFLEILTHSRFPVADREKLPLAVVGCIIGSAKYLDVKHLGALVSGTIDADKLDYMARDGHHAGLALGLDTTRLLSQLQVVTVTEANAPNADLRQRARNSDGHFYNDLGISRAGLGAYEQMVVGRAMLYDRVYYHHKVRAAEAMVRRLVRMVEVDMGKPLGLKQLLVALPDETYLCLLGNIVRRDDFPEVGAKTKEMAESLLTRRIFFRAYALTARCVEGLDSLEPDEHVRTTQIAANQLLDISADADVRQNLEDLIARRASEVAKKLSGIYAPARELTKFDVIVDSPRPDKVAVRGSNVLLRAGTDIEIPNLHFDPEKWSKAYQAQKHCGYVYCRREHIPAVNLAAKLVLAEKMGFAMGPAADRLSKTTGLHAPDIYERLKDGDLITADAYARLGRGETRLLFVQKDEVKVAADWLTSGEPVQQSIATSLRRARSKGLTASQHGAILHAIEMLSTFHSMTTQGGSLREVKIGEEKKLQALLRDHARSAKFKVGEASELGGGETDLILDELLVIENKVYGETDNPLNVALSYGWQARRYALSLSQEVFAVVVGYKPKTENGITAGHIALKIEKLKGTDMVEIRLAVPIDYPVPSGATAPKTNS